MFMKASALSPANIAFVKHWGLTEKGLPYTGSLSMNLSACQSHTSAEFSELYEQDEIWIASEDKDFELLNSELGGRAEVLYRFLANFRKSFSIPFSVKIMSRNSFPADAGLASSASGFSALVHALFEAGGVTLGRDAMLAALTELASFSAFRSLADGFGELLLNDDGLTVKGLHSPLKLVDLSVVLSREKKPHSSLSGHVLAKSSPYFEERCKDTKLRLEKAREALLKGDWLALVEVIDAESKALHKVMRSSRPSLNYMLPRTEELLSLCKEWKMSLDFGVTLDAGPNVHLIVQEKDCEALRGKLEHWGKALKIIESRSCEGTRSTNKHLF